MAKASDNPFPSVLVVEGSTPGNPTAGQQRLFIDSTDGHLKRVDSSGAVTDTESAGSGSGVAVPVFLKRTAGDITVNVAGWQDLAGDGSLDLTMAAVAGDVLDFSAALYCNNAANVLAFDAATIVGGAPVNSFAGGATNGIVGLRAESGVAGGHGASMLYAVQAADLSGGNVTVRLRVNPSNTTARIVASSTATPIQLALRNWGH